jgi:hypothetical protein
MPNTTATIELEIHRQDYYNIFKNLHHMMIRYTNPYIFAVACIGLVTNTLTIILLSKIFLSKSFLTKNPRHIWTLVALGM